MVAGEKVTECCTKAFQVLSKSIEHLKYELAQLGESAETDVDDVRNKYGVDRKGHVGNRVVSSSMTIKLTRSDQRKALLRARIDRHGEGPRKSRTLPPRSEQKQLFQMYNSFKQDRIDYFKSRQPQKKEEKVDYSKAPRHSLVRSLLSTNTSMGSLRALLPKLSADERKEIGAPSTIDNGLWKRNLKMYKKPAELDLALFYIEDSRYEEANQLCERTLKIQASAMGDHHPVCALTLMAWGRSNREQGFLEQALRRQQLALQIRFENYHTISNPLCVEALDEICFTMERKRDFTAAKNICFEIMTRFIGDLGPGHATIADLHRKSTSYAQRYEHYTMAQEDTRARTQYERAHMEAEDTRSRETNVAKLNAILHAGGSLLGIKFLRMFALTETGTFELDFWLAVEDFRRLSAGTVEFEVEVRRIFREFIEPAQILSMLTDAERTEYRMRLAGGAKKAPGPTMYDELQGRVLRAIANGWFLRFEQSQEYANFREALAMQEEGFFREGDTTALSSDGTPLTGSGPGSGSGSGAASAGSSGVSSPHAGNSAEASPRSSTQAGNASRDRRGSGAHSRPSLMDFANGDLYSLGENTLE
eukprot:INCI5882.7.p1 GENE.INCI5882.7~~INCI5882.7.p1  ORF type:complete len:591 (+),score=98.91 INCI5882.7:567-2339(+)